MDKMNYLAILEPNDDNEYGVYFPDFPGCISFGKDLDEAYRNAHEALALHIYGMMEDKEDLPKASDIGDLSQDDVEGNIIVPIRISPDRLKKQIESKRVKTNCTIPLWLKKAGEEAGVNFSKLLEKAIEEELGI